MPELYGSIFHSKPPIIQNLLYFVIRIVKCILFCCLIDIIQINCLQQKQQKQENCQKDKKSGKYPPLNAQMLSFKYDHRNDTPLPLTLRYSFYIPQDCF